MYSGTDCTTCTLCANGYELTAYNAITNAQSCIVARLSE